MAKPGKKNGRAGKVIFFLEILVLAAGLFLLYLFSRISGQLEKIIKPIGDEGKIVMNEKNEKLTGYRTIALFGIDYRANNEELDGQNSDTMIIACLDNDLKEVRLMSLYRDTLVDIGDGMYRKANAAYAYGGPEQAISMLNTNFDLEITDYVMVDFAALTAAVDAFGGLDIPLSYAEIVHLNNYSIEVSEETGEDYTPVPLPDEVPEDQEKIVDTFHLNGVQVTSYCRIRYTASLDMGRAQRQRQVIDLLTEKARTSGLTKIINAMDEVFPYVETSLSMTEILGMVPSLIGYHIGLSAGFPFEFRFSEALDDVIVPETLATTTSGLHQLLYGTVDYEPSRAVQRRSERIEEVIEEEEAKLSERRNTNLTYEN